MSFFVIPLLVLLLIVCIAATLVSKQRWWSICLTMAVALILIKLVESAFTLRAS